MEAAAALEQTAEAALEATSEATAALEAAATEGAREHSETSQAAFGGPAELADAGALSYLLSRMMGCGCPVLSPLRSRRGTSRSGGRHTPLRSSRPSEQVNASAMKGGLPGKDDEIEIEL